LSDSWFCTACDGASWAATKLGFNANDDGGMVQAVSNKLMTLNKKNAHDLEVTTRMNKLRA
jgi:hypothetical protein